MAWGGLGWVTWGETPEGEGREGGREGGGEGGKKGKEEASGARRQERACLNNCGVNAWAAMLSAGVSVRPVGGSRRCAEVRASRTRIAVVASTPSPLQDGFRARAAAAAQQAVQGVMALSLATTLTLAAPAPEMLAYAGSEFVASQKPQAIVDDGNFLSKVTEDRVTKQMVKLKADTGIAFSVVAVEQSEDVSADADAIYSAWYPSGGENAGLMVFAKRTKEVSFAGGQGFADKVGSSGVLDSITYDNIPQLTERDKFNEAVTSSVERIDAVVRGKADPGPPLRAVKERPASNYKSKEEVSENKTNYTNIVVGLLVVSFVVPMVQYFAYVSEGSYDE